MEILITEATVITMTEHQIIENGAIGWEDGIINFVGKSDEVNKENYSQIIDGKDLIVLPGLINAHFHSTSTLLKGMAQDVPESEWMMKALGPISKYLTKEDRILGSKLAVIEGLRTGTTTFAEYSSGVEEIYQQVNKQIGGRVVAAETVNEIVSDKTRQKSGELYQLDYSKGDMAMKRTHDLLQLSQEQEELSVLLGPQALDMVSKERLEEIKQLSQEKNLGIHMHVAQGERERKQIMNRYGKSTIEVLDDLGYLNPQLLAAHCHNTTNDELQKMAQSGVNMVSCQSSIGMIDGIVPPLYDYSKLGGTVAIGTDQVPGVGHVNLFREMRTGAQFAKIVHKDPTVLPPWQMIRHAITEGAKALGLEESIGSLAPDKKADIITIDKNALSINPLVSTPFRSLLPNLIYSATGYEVNNVFISGKQIVTDGEFIGLDSRNLIQQANIRSQEILEEAETDWRDVGSFMVKYTDEGKL